MSESHRCESILVICKASGVFDMFLDEAPKRHREYEVRVTSKYPTGKERENIYRPEFSDEGYAEVVPHNAFCCPVSVVCISWKKDSRENRSRSVEDTAAACKQAQAEGVAETPSKQGDDATDAS